MIKQTDICISRKHSIYVSRQLVYGKLQRKANVEVAKALIEQTLPVFKKLLNIPDDLVFRLSRFKGKYSGKYNSTDRIVNIDPNYKWDKLLETIAHELVHAEQYYEGRLETVFLPKNGWVHQWNGELNTNKGTTYNAYRSQPWEEEAFGRQKKLADAVLKELDK